MSFWPRDLFRATEPGFAVLFGDPWPSSEPAGLEASQEIGEVWLYALHSWSAIARGRMWQATMMLDHFRERLLVLVCLRQDLSPRHGREADRLSPPVLDALQRARATTTALPELSRSHQALVRTLIDEVAFHDRGLFVKLNASLGVLSRFDA